MDINLCDDDVFVVVVVAFAVSVHINYIRQRLRDDGVAADVDMPSKINVRVVHLIRLACHTHTRPDAQKPAGLTICLFRRRPETRTWSNFDCASHQTGDNRDGAAE